MARRDAILSVLFGADLLHKEFDTKARAERSEGRIDVFGMLVDRDIPAMFRPLRNLLGAYIDNPEQGVIVTTQQSLPVQRFTPANELGNAVPGHEATLDEKKSLPAHVGLIGDLLRACKGKLLGSQSAENIQIMWRRLFAIGRQRRTWRTTWISSLELEQTLPPLTISSANSSR